MAPGPPGCPTHFRACRWDPVGLAAGSGRPTLEVFAWVLVAVMFVFAFDMKTRASYGWLPFTGTRGFQG